MTTSVAADLGYTVTVVGGTFTYGVTPVADTTTGKTFCYPSHFALNAIGTKVNPATDDTAQLLLNATRALTAALNAAVLQNAASLAALIATLPTTQPATSGQLWLNGPVLSLS